MKIKNILCPLSPLAVQVRIVQKFNELMKYCNELGQGIQHSKQLNEKLLKQVLKEALRPKEGVEV